MRSRVIARTRSSVAFRLLSRNPSRFGWASDGRGPPSHVAILLGQHQVRILHVNKFLYRRGGAEAYMEDLADLQIAAGHTVAFFGMAHPQNTHLEYAAEFPSHIELEPPPPTLIGRARGVARMLYSTSASRGMDNVLADFQPDVVHMHNIYHQLSPSVLRPVARRRIPAVMTLHDYKLACPTYQFLDHGNLCQACLGGHFNTRSCAAARTDRSAPAR